jgi:hypothetical protein
VTGRSTPSTFYPSIFRAAASASASRTARSPHAQQPTHCQPPTRKPLPKTKPSHLPRQTQQAYLTHLRVSDKLEQRPQSVTLIYTHPFCLHALQKFPHTATFPFRTSTPSFAPPLSCKLPWQKAFLFTFSLTCACCVS